MKSPDERCGGEIPQHRCIAVSDFSVQDSLAKDFLKQEGVIIVHKATRSGCTMSLCKSSYELGKKITVIYPTRRIAREIEREIPRILGRQPRTAIIKPNTELCRKLDPKLDLKFQFKKNCSNCRFQGFPSKCAFQKLLSNSFDIYCLTYDKLRALQKSASEEAEVLLEKLRGCSVFIFDEFTTAVIRDIPTVTVMSLDKSKNLVKMSTLLQSDFADRVQCLHQAKNKMELDFWLTVFRFLSQFENISQSRVYENKALKIFSDEKLTDLFRYGWKRITELTAEGRDTSKLQDVFLTSLKREVVLAFENGDVKVTPRLEDALGYIREFTQTLSDDKLIFAVDSYQPSVNFDRVFGRHVIHWLWGENGDPLRTNDQQLVLCDRAHWGEFNFRIRWAIRQGVHHFIKGLLRQFSPEQLIIVTTNKAMRDIIYTWNLSKDVKLTWHRSDWMRGVPVEDRRIMLCIGGPYLPKKAYVPESHSFNFKDFSDKLENLSASEQFVQISKRLRIDDTKSELVNAIGRVKDPKGKERSLVITLGMTYRDVTALLKEKGELSVSRPHVIQPLRKGGLQRDGLWTARLWMEKANVQVEDLPVIARVIRCTYEKRSVRASEVIPHETRLIVEKAEEYKETLDHYGVTMLRKQGGVTFELT